MMRRPDRRRWSGWGGRGLCARRGRRIRDRGGCRPPPRSARRRVAAAGGASHPRRTRPDARRGAPRRLPRQRLGMGKRPARGHRLRPKPRRYRLAARSSSLRRRAARCRGRRRRTRAPWHSRVRREPRRRRLARHVLGPRPALRLSRRRHRPRCAPHPRHLARASCETIYRSPGSPPTPPPRTIATLARWSRSSTTAGGTRRWPPAIAASSASSPCRTRRPTSPSDSPPPPTSRRGCAARAYSRVPAPPTPPVPTWPRSLVPAGSRLATRPWPSIRCLRRACSTRSTPACRGRAPSLASDVTTYTTRLATIRDAYHRQRAALLARRAQPRQSRPASSTELP